MDLEVFESHKAKVVENITKSKVNDESSKDLSSESEETENPSFLPKFLLGNRKKPSLLPNLLNNLKN